MTTAKITMHLYQVQFDFDDKPRFILNTSSSLAQHKHASEDVWVYIGPREVEVEVPEIVDMRAHQVEALREQERTLRAEFTKRVTEINARINKLLALEMPA